jgi:predicted nuclease with RNAse H fold
MAAWCRDEIAAQVVAADAPCRWSAGPDGRAAERELLRRGIRCFLAPTHREALRHPAGFYDWMLNGEKLFRALERTHPLCRALPRNGQRCCFETFPHAITWNLRGGKADVACKRAQRSALLRKYGVRTDLLTNMDWIDAALCALAADLLATHAPMQFHGEARTGVIIAPALRVRKKSRRL